MENLDLREVMSAIRVGSGISDQIAARVNTFPVIDKLRDLVERGDVPRLFEMAKSDSVAKRALAFSLFHKWAELPEVREFLRGYWDGGTSIEERLNLIWQLLDNAELPIEVHRSVYAFVNENEAEFRRLSIEYYVADGGEILSAIADRLLDTTFPRTKHWIYLCVASASGDNLAKRLLFAAYATDQIGINAGVARDMLVKLGSGPTAP